jgi:hypothetical protein
MRSEHGERIGVEPLHDRIDVGFGNHDDLRCQISDC